MKVLVDIDDVIVDFLPAWCKWLNLHYGLDVNWENITDWDMTKFYPTLNKFQIFEPLTTDVFFKTVVPKKDSQKYLKKLIDDGFEVYLCTATDYRNVAAKIDHIAKRYFSFIGWENVIVTSKKQMIKADYLIDDAIHNLVDGEYKKILFDMPHNRKFNAEEHGIKRVYSWKEIYEFLTEEKSNEK